jgi:hypothetical protein
MAGQVLRLWAQLVAVAVLEPQVQTPLELRVVTGGAGNSTAISGVSPHLFMLVAAVVAVAVQMLRDAGGSGVGGDGARAIRYCC